MLLASFGANSGSRRLGLGRVGAAPNAHQPRRNEDEALVRAIFELERRLIASHFPGRAPSTMCAVKRPEWTRDCWPCYGHRQDDAGGPRPQNRSKMDGFSRRVWSRPRNIHVGATASPRPAPNGATASPRPGGRFPQVNRSARFRPHLDAGSAGAGQRTSLIVALGDFGGGELVVERDPVDIRYAPLEFDGWRQRHWTRPFV